MLYLNPPFPIINGVALFPDHQNPLHWYFMPTAPKLSMIPDPVAGEKPALQLIKFRGDAGSGGFLNFDVNIGLGQAAQDDIKAELRSAQFRLPPGPIALSPVPLTGGTVKLVLLGEETPVPATPRPGGGGAVPPPPASTGPRFVTKISHNASPALYDPNQAAFSVALDQFGVTVLEEALQGNMSPIGVIYALDYLALRPAYSVHLNIDWDRVQDHMDEQFGVDSLFTSVSIEKAVDTLIEERAIVLEIDTFVPEGEDNASVIASRDRAVNEVRDMITDTFFTSSIDPVKPRGDDWDKATKTAARVGTMVATGGWGGIGTFSYNKRSYKRTDAKVLNVNMRERTTVLRHIYPQGHLTGLFQVLRDLSLPMSEFVVDVDLNDPWFEQRKVTVISRANYTADSIASVNATLKYGDSAKNVILDAQHPTADVKWLSRITNGAMDLPVSVQYTVSFTNVDGTERPLELTSPAEVTTVGNVEIEPRKLYSMVPIPIAVSNPATFPWARYPSVEVRTEYQDAEHGIHDQERFVLGSETSEQVWNLFVRRQGPVEFRYTVVFRAADHKDHETPMLTASDREVIITDPFPARRAVLIVPPANWDGLSQAFVDCVYEDPDNDFRHEESFDFSEASHPNKTFAVALRDPANRRVGFSVTFMDANGGVVEIPKSYTVDNRIILRSDMLGHRIISVRAPGVNFEALKLRELQAALRYVDADASLRYEGHVTLRSSAEDGAFEFDYVDAGKSRYEYKLSAVFRNGMTQEFEWAFADGDDLNLQLT